MKAANRSGHALKLDPRNIRRHSERNRVAIAKSLESVGAGRGVLADADGIIRAGNGVFEEWQRRGGKIKVVETDGKTLVVTKRRDLRGKKAVQAALLDNLTADTSAFEYEQELLKEALANDDISRSIAEQCDELRGLLKSEPQPETVDAGELIDRAAELQKKWQVARGDLWVIPSKTAKGEHRILCGDATNADDVARLMRGGEKAAMTFIDPPYNALKSWKNGRAGGGARLDTSRWFQNDNMEWDDYDAFLRLAFANLKGHSVYICCDYRIYPRLTGLVKDAGYDLKHCIVWKKNVWGLGERYRFQHEFIIYACKGDAPFYGGHDKSDVWEENSVRNEHSTPKPVGLPRRAISNSSKQMDIVLDVFLGSGTTMVAAETLGRICYGLEIEPRYCAVSLEHLSALGLECRRAEP